MRIKIASLTILALFASLTFSASCQNAKAPTYHNPAGNEFPISTLGSFEAHSIPSVERYATVRDAGFNLSIESVANDNLLEEALNCAGQAGVKLIVTTPNSRNIKTLPDFVKKFCKNKDLAGYYIADEPKASAFAKFREFRDVIYKYDSVHLPLITLLPYVEPKRLEATSYRAYLNEFDNTVNLPLLCYDNYPIFSNKGKISVRDNFFKNLEIVSSVAKQSGRPFWSFCLSTKHYDYPSATIPHLLFEAFSSLAYGSQGIIYYTYGVKYWESIKYYDAPIDSAGNKTKIWYYVQNVNRQIQNLKSVFLGCEVIDVAHTGKSIPDGTKRLSSLPSAFKSLSTGDEGTTVSHIKNNGKEYLIIVNHDVNNKQKIKIEKNVPLLRVESNGRMKIFKSSSFSLDPGGYAIFTW